MKISVIGGGSWATALVKLISDRGSAQQQALTWWVRREETAQHLKTFGHNPDYLSSLSLPTETMQITNNLQEAIAASDLIILAVPSAFLFHTLKPISALDFRNKLVASAIKGVVPQTFEVVGAFLKNHYQIPEENLLVIGGPCHAEEVAQEKLSFLTIASVSDQNARLLANLLLSRNLKTKVSPDFYGSEYAAVLKNVYAIAGGICHGLGYGDNFQAVLMSYATKEMQHFIDLCSPMPDRQIADPVYLGDLLVTAYSQFSRNRTFGNMIGKGYSVKFAQLEMNMVAEGYYATKSMHQILEDMALKMPILESVYEILYMQKPAQVSIKRLIESFE